MEGWVTYGGLHVRSDATEQVPPLLWMLPGLLTPLQRQYKGDFLGDCLGSGGQRVFFPGYPLLLLRLVTRIQQTVASLSWTGGVCRSVSGCSWLLPASPHPRPAPLLSQLFRDELPGEEGTVLAFGAPHLPWGRGCCSGMGMTRCFEGSSFQIGSLVAGGDPSSCCLQAPDVPSRGFLSTSGLFISVRGAACCTPSNF